MTEYEVNYRLADASPEKRKVDPYPQREDDRAAAPIRVRNAALSILAILAVVVLLRYAREFFIPLVVSLLIAYALDPFVTLLERLRIHRTIASLVTVIALVLVTGSAVYTLRRQVTTVLDSVPNAIGDVRNQIEKLRHSTESTSTIGKLQQTVTEIEKTAAEASNSSSPRGVTKVQIEQPVFRANEYLWSGSVGLLGLLSDAVLVVFLVFFQLSAGDLFKRKLVRLIGTRLSEKRVTLETLNEITSQVERFLLIQVLTSIAVGLCTTVALWAFGLDQAAFWGAMTGILSSVPYLGPICVTAALAIVSFIQFDSLTMAAEIVAIPLTILTIEGFLLKPAIMGKAARMNGAAMFVGLLFWTWMWGLIGTIVAVPIMMVIKSVCDRIESFRFIGEILDER